MKKSIIFGALIVIMFVGLTLSVFTASGFLMDNGYIITDGSIEKALNHAVNGSIQDDIELIKVEMSEPLYTRNSSLYVGEDKIPVNTSFPLILENGTTVCSFNDSIKMVTSEFDQLWSYEGMYVANGSSYNADRELADDDEFILLFLENGLFINVQGMRLITVFGEYSVPVMSIAKFTENGIYYYTLTRRSLGFDHVTSLNGATIVIGDNAYKYSEFYRFIMQLKDENIEISEPVPSATPIPLNEPDKKEEIITEPKREDYIPLSRETIYHPAGFPAVENEQELTGSGIGEIEHTQNEENKKNIPNNQEEFTPYERPTPPPDEISSPPDIKQISIIPKPTDISKPETSEKEKEKEVVISPTGNGAAEEEFRTKEDEKEEEEEGLSYEEPEDEEVYDTITEPQTQVNLPAVAAPPAPEAPKPPAKSSAAPVSGGSIADNDEEAPLDEIPYRPDYSMPKLSYGEFKAGVYSISGEIIDVNDPAARISKAIRFYVYNAETGKLYLRKAVRGAEKFEINSLVPGTEYIIKGQFGYLDEYDEEQECVFLDEYRISTKPMSMLEPIDLIWADSEVSYTHMIMIDGICINNATENEAAQNIAAMQIITEKEGGILTERIVNRLSSATIKKLKGGGSYDWLSGENLDSFSTYNYQIVLYDRYENELPMRREPTAGTAKTCKVKPTALINAESILGEQSVSCTIRTMIKDEDEAITQGKLYLVIKDEKNKRIPVNGILESKGVNQNINFSDCIYFDATSETKLITNSLTPGTNYRVEVICDYDIEDKSIHENEIIGSISFVTVTMSALGFAYYEGEATNITAKSAVINVSVSSRTVELLREIINHVELTIESTDTTISTITLNKENLSKSLEEYSILKSSDGKRRIKIHGENSEEAGVLAYLECEAEDISSFTEYTPWQSFINSASGNGAELVIEMKECLDSSAEYVVKAQTMADYGGIEYDMTVAGNIIDFRTLRAPAKTIINNQFITADRIELYDVSVYDKDGAVLDGKVTISLADEVSVIKTLIIPVNEVQETLSFTGLKKGNEYKLTFTAKEYNEGYTYASYKNYYTIKPVYQFVTGDGVTGNLELQSVEYRLEENEFRHVNLFDWRDIISGGYYSGTMIATNFVIDASSYYVDIPVREGAEYYICGFRYNYKYYLKSDRTLAGGAQNIYDGTVLKIPENEGISFIRLQGQMNATRVNGVYNSDPGVYLYEASLASGNDYIYDSETDTEKICGMYLNPANGAAVTSASYFYTGFINVDECTIYEKTRQSVKNTNASASSYIFFYDKDQVFLTSTLMHGGKTLFTAPEKAAYVRFTGLNNTTEIAGSENIKLKVYRSRQDKLTAAINLSLFDQKNDLIYNPECYVRLYKADIPIVGAVRYSTPEVSTYPISIQDTIDGSKVTQNLIKELNLQTEEEKLYKIVLSIKIYGHEMIIDELEFSTKTQLIVIDHDQELRQIELNPCASYLVAVDLKSDVRLLSSIAFYGSLDFDGHTIERTTQGYIFYCVKETGTIKNIVVNEVLPAGCPQVDYGSIVMYNYGTIKNVILKLDHSAAGQLPNRYFGGIAYNNSYGTIENYVIAISSDIYFYSHSGLAVYSNSGVIRNGYVYASENHAVRVVKDTATVKRHSYVGSMVGYNTYAGEVYSAYSLVPVYTYEEGTEISTSDQNGTLIGVNYGKSENIYTTADVTEEGTRDDYMWHYDYGPVFGYTSGKVKNAYYFSENSYADITNQIKADKRLLSDYQWQESILHTEGFYIRDYVSIGCFPRVILPESMMEKQPVVYLPETAAASEVRVISAVVTEQRLTEAYCTLSMDNVSNLLIEQVEVENVSCDILDQKWDGDLYRVNIRLYDAEKYFSSYNILSIVCNGNIQYTYGTGQTYPNVSVAAEFYKPVFTVDDWSDIADNPTQNYRLYNDLDFSNRDMANIYIASFYGKLDGGKYNPSGECIGEHTISSITNTVYSGIISNLYGEIKNLHIKGYEATSLRCITSRSYIGLVSYSPSGSFFNVHAEDIKITGNGYLGGLVGYAVKTTIINCSVSNIVLNSAYVLDRSFAAGGIVGYATYQTNCTNCYAADIDISVTRVGDIQGVGGVAGYIYVGCAIENCYATGQINNNERYSGGIVGNGYSTARVEKCWTNVVIITNKDFAGGISGNSVLCSNNIACGSIFSRIMAAGGDTEDTMIHRTTGNPQITSSYECVNYAFCNQRINTNEINNETGKNEELLTQEELRSRSCYERILGDGFYYEDNGSGQTIYNGFLPLLYGTDRKVLPYQKANKLADSMLAVETERSGYELDDNSDKQYYAVIRVKNMSEKGLLTIKDAVLECMQVEKQNGQNYLLEQIPGAEGIALITIKGYLNNYYDSYHLSVILTDGISDVELHAKISFGGEPVFYDIMNVNEWQSFFNEHNAGSENVRIRGDIDFMEVSYPITGVVVNRMNGDRQGGQGSDIGVSIKNLTLVSSSSRTGVINDITSSLTNITFENITVEKTKKSSSYDTIIMRNFGYLKNIGFKNCTINSIQNSTYCGCIGYNAGTIDTVNLDTISYKAVNGSSGYYIGGLVGYAVAGNPISGVTAKNITINAPGAYYTGGIAGISYTSICLASAENISVIGKYYAGGITGYTSGSYPVQGISDNERAVVSGIQVDVVSDSGYTGGINGYGYARYLDIYDIKINTGITGVVPASNQIYVGGINGYGSSRTEFCSITSAEVNGYENVGGVCGYGNAVDTSVTDVVIKGSLNVGGMIGKGYARNSSLRGSEIYGMKNVGGMAGLATSTSIYNCYTIDCVFELCAGTDSGENFGGIFGYCDASLNSEYGNGVMDCTIGKSSYKEGKKISFVGGMIGYTDALYYLSYSYVQDTEVYGYTRVGGIAGELTGSYVYYTTVEADVFASGDYAGGAAGYINSYNKKGTEKSYGHSMMYNCILTGNVCSDNYAGGLYGFFNKGTGSAASMSRLDGSRYYNLVMASDLISISGSFTDDSGSYGNKNVSFLANTIDGTGMHTIRYLKAYEGMTLRRPVIAGEEASDGFTAIEFTDEEVVKNWYAKSADYSSPGETAEFTKYETGKNTAFYTNTPLYLGSDELKDERFYLKSLNTGGMGISSAETTRQFDFTGLTGKVMEDGTTSYYLPYIRYSAKRGLWQAGYTMGEVTVNEKQYCTYTDNAPAEKTSAEDADTARANYTDGIQVPTHAPVNITKSNRSFALRMSLRMLNKGILNNLDSLGAIPKLQVYASGAGRVNLEFSGDYEAAQASYRLFCGDNTIYTGEIHGRVYTMEYDYCTDFSVEVFNENSSQTYDISAIELRNHLSVYGDEYYYINSGNVYTDNRTLGGTAVHVFNDEMIDESGTVHGIETGEERYVVNNFMLCPVYALYKTEYNNTMLEAYYGFTSVSDNSGESVTRDSLIISRENTLYTLPNDNSIYIHGFIIDNEDINTYFTLLDKSGRLINMGSAIKFPEDFKNDNIVEITNNLHSDLKVILVRYENSIIVGFNYLTGEEIKLSEDIYDSISLTDYLLDFTSELFIPEAELDVKGYFDNKEFGDRLVSHQVDIDRMLAEESDNVDGDTKDAVKSLADIKMELLDEELHEYMLYTGVITPMGEMIDGEIGANGQNKKLTYSSNLSGTGVTAGQASNLLTGDFSTGADSSDIIPVNEAAAEEAQETKEDETSAGKTQETKEDETSAGKTQETKEDETAAEEAQETKEDETAAEYMRRSELLDNIKEYGKGVIAENENTDTIENSGITVWKEYKQENLSEKSKQKADKATDTGESLRQEYIIVYDRASSGYKLYNTDGYLNTEKELLISENEKVERLKEKGADIEFFMGLFAYREEESSIRKTIFIILAGCVAVLSASLIIRRRRFTDIKNR